MELIIYWKDSNRPRTVLTHVKDFDTQFGVLSGQFDNGKLFDFDMPEIDYISIHRKS